MRIIVGDNQFAALCSGAMPVSQGVLDVHRLDVQIREHAADRRVIVEADHHLALHGLGQRGHADVLIELERDAIAFGLPIGRVQVEEGVRAIVAIDAAFPGKVFDVDTIETQVSGAQGFFEAQQVESGRGGGGGAEVLALHFAPERELLQVEEARGALDVGESFRLGHLVPFEYLPAGQRPFELPDKLLEVTLDHAVEVDQLAVDVIDDFNIRRRWPQEEQRCSSSCRSINSMI